MQCIFHLSHHRLISGSNKFWNFGITFPGVILNQHISFFFRFFPGSCNSLVIISIDNNYFPAVFFDIFNAQCSRIFWDKNNCLMPDIAGCPGNRTAMITICCGAEYQLFLFSFFNYLGNAIGGTKTFKGIDPETLRLIFDKQLFNSKAFCQFWQRYQGSGRIAP